MRWPSLSLLVLLLGSGCERHVEMHPSKDGANVLSWQTDRTTSMSAVLAELPAGQDNEKTLKLTSEHGVATVAIRWQTVTTTLSGGRSSLNFPKEVKVPTRVEGVVSSGGGYRIAGNCKKKASWNMPKTVDGTLEHDPVLFQTCSLNFHFGSRVMLATKVTLRGDGTAEVEPPLNGQATLE
jgi:hypothetical protein